MKVLTLLILFIYCVSPSICCGQNLRIDFTNGDSEIFPITEVISIKAELDTIQLQLNDGSLYLWSGSDIRKMNHETVLTSVGESIKSDALIVFPNPSVGEVAISIDASKLSSSTFTLEIFDISGQLVNQIPFHSNTSTVWNGTDQANNAVPSGTYLCVVSDKAKRFTQKVVIQR